jgi:hypothetical protein
LNTYGQEAGTAAEVSDVLFKTVELGRLRLGEIGNILGRVLPLTSQMGVSFKEASAAIAVMTRQGVRADTAVTQLRAVMQKIIKPTEAMSDLFRSWGVRDGADAIKTFGGLQAVLQKMSNEVGGSNTEMAEYFRRVRAIVGQMSLMNNEGKLMIDTMDEMENSIGAVEQAWADFENADAQKLTKVWNELKNSITEVGRALSPLLVVLIGWAEPLLKSIPNVIRGIEKMVNPLATVKHEMDDLLNYFDDLPPLVIKPARSMTEEYKKAAQEARRSLVEVKAEWFRLADAAEASNKRATGVAKSALGDLASDYKQSFSGLKKIANDLPNAIKKSRDKITDINAKAEDRDHARKLRQAPNEFAQRKVYESKYQKLRYQLSKLTNKRMLTDEDARAADRLHNQIIELSNSREIAANETKRRNDENKWRQRQSSADTQMKKFQGNLNRSAKERADLAADANRQLNIQAAEVEEITKKIEDQLEVVAQANLKRGPGSAATKKAAVDTIKELQAQLKKFKFTDQQKAFMKSLGLDTSGMDRINDEIEKGLQKRLIKFAIDLDNIQSQLDKAQLVISGQLDIKGTKRRAEVLDVPDRDSKDPIELSEATTAKAVELDQQNNEARQQFKKLEGDIESFYNRFKGTGQNIISEIVRPDEISQASLTAGEWYKIWENALEKRAGRAHKSGQQLLQDFANQRTSAKGITDEFVKQLDTINKIAEQVTQGRKLSDFEITQKRKAVKAAYDEGKISLNAKVLLEKRLDLLNQMVLKEREKANVQKNIVVYEDQLKAIKEQLDASEKVVGKNGEIKKTGKEAATAYEDGKKGLDGVNTKMQQVNKTQGEVKDGSEEVKHEIFLWGSSAYHVLNPLKLVENKLIDIKKAAKEANDEIAGNSGSGASGGAHHYGKFFNYGGRGQDTIPAMLSAGETVVSRRNSQRFFSQLNAMNQGSQPVYREQGGPVTNVGDINVSVNGGDSSQQTVREIGNALRREIKRGTLKLS